jgi:hypothetical protein
LTSSNRRCWSTSRIKQPSHYPQPQGVSEKNDPTYRPGAVFRTVYGQYRKEHVIGRNKLGADQRNSLTKEELIKTRSFSQHAQREGLVPAELATSLSGDLE